MIATRIPLPITDEMLYFPSYRWADDGDAMPQIIDRRMERQAVLALLAPRLKAVRTGWGELYPPPPSTRKERAQRRARAAISLPSFRRALPPQ